MKNLLLGITTTIAIVSTLEATNVTNFIEEDPHNFIKVSESCDVYCQNDNREQDTTIIEGGVGIDEKRTIELMKNARRIIEERDIPLKFEYFLSKEAFEDLFNNDNTATGVFIAPFFENDSINLLVGNSHWKNTGIENPKSFSYVIKTFCPIACEIDTHVSSTGTTGTDSTGTDTSSTGH